MTAASDSAVIIPILNNPSATRRTSTLWTFVAWTAWICCFSNSFSAPFTYQGRLVDSGVLATGNFELRFRLFNQLSAGTQIGTDQSLTPVAVTNGLFTVTLDFGATAFNGEDRWLEIAARPANSSAPIDILAPRQPVNAVPYAMFALNAANDTATKSLITQLTTTVNALSNQLQTVNLSGLTAASSDPADATLSAKGFVRYQSLAAPAWKNGTGTGAPAARVAQGAV
jgi:hypothetical protein